jgi:hypothetical protein
VTAASPQRRFIAGGILLACLVQILLFYVGLLQTTRRIMGIWGKSVEERRAMLGQPWAALKPIAERFPEDARIYVLYPEQHLHCAMNYYFYPRQISVSMTNGLYRIVEDYDRWAEMPDDPWLITNHYTHVLTFKDGGRAWPVHPGVSREIAEWEQSHAKR